MKQLINYIKNNYKILLLVIAGSLIVGYFIGESPNHQITESPNQDESTHQHINESTNPTTWTCSMHPQIKQDKPGKCPICAMDLIPLTAMNAESADADPYEILISESAAELANIQSVVVSKGIPKKTIYLQGKVQADERNVAVITARFGGRIEELFVNFTGQDVRKGEKLATIYSPDLVTAQRELLEAVTFKDSRPSLYYAVRNKLKLWDLTDKQISDIEERGEPQNYFDVLSPISGNVIMRHVAKGDYVKEGTTLFKMIDLSKVWVMFDAYESDLPWIKVGDKVDFTIQALPGEKFSAKVSYIDPFIDAQTRVAKIRVSVSNPKMSLKPEMFANGLLESKITESSNEVLVPKSSVLWTGKRAIVYVKVPDRESPSFLYREVVLGPELGSYFVVTEGLEEGEEIATNGVFKIDAAAQLVGYPSMMNPEGGKASTGHNHGDIKMTDEQMENKEKSDKKKDITKFHTPDEFNDQLNNFVDDYLMMKDAFVDSDDEKVDEFAQKALASIGKVDMSLLKGDTHNYWMKINEPIVDNLKGIIQMKGLEMKRKHFSVISDKLYSALESFGNPGHETRYYQYCPMAFDNKGAYWISQSSDIRNPYFGDKMLKCGETKVTIK